MTTKAAAAARKAIIELLKINIKEMRSLIAALKAL